MTTLEDAGRIARRLLGPAHPLTAGIEDELRKARAALGARETPPPSGSARDPSAAGDDDATPAAPATSADSSPDGSSGEAPAGAARDAEDPSSK